MKKISLLFTLLFSVLMLASCGGKSNSSTTDNTKPSETITETEDEKAIKLYNNIIEQRYTSFDVVIISTKGDLKLTSNYSVVKKENTYEITYSVQQYNEFDFNGENIPDEMISTTEGVYSTSSSEFNLNKFKFANGIFNSYKFSNGSLTTTISNARNYLGVDYDCTNFEMIINYNNTLTSIKYNYYLTDQTYCQVIYKNFK